MGNLRVKFKNIEEQLVEVLLIEDEDSTVYDDLVAGAQPFVTDDESDGDMLLPGRSCSGNIGVIYTDDTAAKIDAMWPTYSTEIYVQVKVAGALKWQGYVQPQQFGRQMYVYGEELQIPVMDLLGTMADKQMPMPDTIGQVQFVELILEAMGCFGEGKLTDVVFPRRWTSARGNGLYECWLKLNCSVMNFVTVNTDENEDDPDWQRYDRKNYKEILEGIAQLMGWTVYVDGTSLVFADMQLSDTTYVKMDVDNLESLRDDATSYDKTTGVFIGGTVQVANLTHSAMDQQMQTQEGCKSVKVQANCNPVSDLDIKITASNLDYARKYEVQGPGSGKRLKTIVMVSRQNEDQKLYSYELRRVDLDECDCRAVGYDAATDDVPCQADGGYLSSQVGRVDLYNQSDATSGAKINYDYKDALVVKNQIPTYTEDDQENFVEFPGVKLAEWDGVYMPKIDGGCIDIHLSELTMQGSTSNMFLTMMLKIGPKYWNGTGWVTRQSTFNIIMKGGANKVTKTLGMPYDGASGHVVPLTAGMSGMVHVELYGNTSVIKWGVVRQTTGVSEGVTLFTDLSVKYCNLENVYGENLQDHATYSAAGAQIFKDKKSASLMFASKTAKMKQGHGILYDWSGALVKSTTMWYGQTQMLPEKALLAKMKDAYFGVKNVASPTVRVTTVPKIGVRCRLKSKNWRLVARSIDWKMCDVKLTMVSE